MILATDMEKHNADLTRLKSVVKENSIDKGKIESLSQCEDQKEVFNNQQFILECAIHSSDLSQGTRDWEIVHDWTYLLFDEFFMQGDLEL